MPNRIVGRIIRVYIIFSVILSIICLGIAVFDYAHYLKYGEYQLLPELIAGKYTYEYFDGDWSKFEAAYDYVYETGNIASRWSFATCLMSAGLLIGLCNPLVMFIEIACREHSLKEIPKSFYACTAIFWMLMIILRLYVRNSVFTELIEKRYFAAIHPVKIMFVPWVAALMTAFVINVKKPLDVDDEP